MQIPTFRPKQFLLLVYDIWAVNVALFLAYFFRHNTTLFEHMEGDYPTRAALVSLVFLCSYLAFRLYQRVWNFAGLHDYFTGLFSNFIAGLLLCVLELLMHQSDYALIILTFILATALTLGARIGIRVLRHQKILQSRRKQDLERTLIIGAGDGGNLAVRELQASTVSTMRPVSVVDDDPIHHGWMLSGVPVVGDTTRIPEIVEKDRIDVILLAIPSLKEERRREILQLCRRTGKPVRSLLGIHDFRPDQAFLDNIRDVDPEILLGKSVFHYDKERVSGYLKGKRILITGAAGNMGSTLARQVAAYEPQSLILLDINENGLHELVQHLNQQWPDLSVAPVILTVKDQAGVTRMFRAHQPHVVFHCAFHNQEDFIGGTPSEVIRNNVFGTYHLVCAASNCGTEKLILLSDDQASHPNSLVHATKRICEMIAQGGNLTSQTRISAVRFGDLNSNAYYYFQRFREEIQAGGPLILEHEGMTRFFASKQDASRLILEAVTQSQGGEVFSLDLGQPLRIADLAKNVAELAGYALGEDLQLRITGNGKGTPVQQEKVEDPAGLNQTQHPNIFASRQHFDDYNKLESKLQDLRLILDQGEEEVIRYQIDKTVNDLIPDFVRLSFDESGLYIPPASDSSNRIWLSSPHMGGLERHYVNEAFDTNWVAPLGPNVNQFEQELSEYVQTTAAAAMSSGTAAIHIALRLLDAQQNDYVFCSSLTFSGSANPILYEKAIPVFIDAEPGSWNMSPVALEKAFVACKKEGKMPKAVIVVNLYGQSADYDSICALCDHYKVPIIEDAAESLGATYKGQQTGNFGRFGVFSFNGNKIITTSGGGMLVSEDEDAIKKARFLITQARDQARHYQHSELGFNYRMSNISAGIGRGQLKVLPMRIEQKKKIYQYYKQAFADIPYIHMMPVAPYGEPIYWLSTITLDDDSPIKPLDILLALEKQNIESRPVWKPMHLQPFFERYPFYSHNDTKQASISEALFQQGVCLPSDTKMTEGELERVAGHIIDVFNQATQQPS